MIWAALAVAWVPWVIWAAAYIAWKRKRGQPAVVCDVLLIPSVLSVVVLVVAIWSSRAALWVSGIVTTIAVVVPPLAALIDSAERAK